MGLSTNVDKGTSSPFGGDFFAIAYNESWQGYNLS